MHLARTNASDPTGWKNVRWKMNKYDDTALYIKPGIHQNKRGTLQEILRHWEEWIGPPIQKCLHPFYKRQSIGIIEERIANKQ